MEKSSKDQRRMKYQIGDSVEVHSSEEGFVGSYYAAKVLGVSKNHVFVEYETLLSDDESTLLRERVPVSKVRPCPPQLPVSNFHLWDEVDAYDNDGWWVGSITSIAEIPKKRKLKDESSKYYVYFSGTGDVNAYPFSRLRLHQEWKNGNWVPSSSCH